LAGEASADEIHLFKFCDCFDVSIPFDVWPMFLEDLDAVGVVLDLPFALPSCTFKSKV
jgi:hypothetical protein